MTSLYECSVLHNRLKPKRHAFNYGVFMLSVDLEELPAIARRVYGFSHNRFNLFSIDDRDHVTLGHPGGIRGNLIAWVNEQGLGCSDDVRVQLITFPRVFGYGFNPVSFYYLTSKLGEPIAAVAEVVNTYREMKLYLVDQLNPQGMWHRRVAKNFYVSPFSDPGDEFDFTIGNPDNEWHVNIDNYCGSERVLLSAIRGKQRTFSSARLIGYAFKYPLLSLKIIGLIHWHAFLLWARRVPFFRKSQRREVQLDVMRPQSSLNKNLP
jgi:uncharacterized protein